ncbi:MAG: type III secretion protein [Myxococcota bacterium]
MTSRAGRFLVGWLVTATLVGCTVELQHDLEEDDANDIYVLLQKNGIEAKKLKDEGGNEPRYVISVAKGDVATAAQLLREYSLPRPKAEGLGIFRKSKGMIPTQTEERAMYIEALGGEVSNALNRVPGVLEARTIVVMPEVNDLTQPDKKPEPSASVFVKYRPVADGKAPLSDEDIKAFVATAVPEMKAANVTVLKTLAMPPEAEGSPEQRMVTVFSLRMAKGSADQFKLMVLGAGLFVLAMVAVAGWSLTRGGTSSAAKARARARVE